MFGRHQTLHLNIFLITYENYCKDINGDDAPVLPVM